MRQVISAFTACALLGAASIGMPAVAQAQTIIIINGNQPQLPPPYPSPLREHVVYGYPTYYGGGYGYYNNVYYNGYYNGECYADCYPRPYWR
jgi:hypothetical protein